MSIISLRSFENPSSKHQVAILFLGVLSTKRSIYLSTQLGDNSHTDFHTTDHWLADLRPFPGTSATDDVTDDAIDLGESRHQ